MQEEHTPPLARPRYLGHWLLCGLLWLIVQLPQPLRMTLGGWLGRLFFRLTPYRRAISAANLAIAFPALDDAARQKLLRAHAESIGRGIIETGMAWFLSEKRLLALSRFEADPAALALLRDPHTPVVLVGSHSTLMELGVRLLGLYVKAGGMYRPLNDPFFHHWIRHHRARAATELIHYKDMRHTLRFLQAGGNLWYALDQDMGPRVSVFAPFFGLDAAETARTHRRALGTGVHVARRKPLHRARRRRNQAGRRRDGYRRHAPHQRRLRSRNPPLPRTVLLAASPLQKPSGRQPLPLSGTATPLNPPHLRSSPS